MKFAEVNKDKILELYKQGCSSYEIAELLNTNPSRVLRSLEYLGKTLHGDPKYYKRSYSEAQKLALEKGRHKHPTKGTKLPPKHKQKISNSLGKYFSKLTEEERKKISQMSKERWENLPEAKKEELRRLAWEACRNAAKAGSKLELALVDRLKKEGYEVDFHKSNLIPGEKLVVDIYIPEYRLAIEVDGPSHFLPIWGDEKLRKQQESDAKKQGLLLKRNINILRIRNLNRKMTLVKIHNIVDAVVNFLKTHKFPTGQKRCEMVELEAQGKHIRLL